MDDADPSAALDGIATNSNASRKAVLTGRKRACVRIIFSFLPGTRILLVLVGAAPARAARRAADIWFKSLYDIFFKNSLFSGSSIGMTSLYVKTI